MPVSAGAGRLFLREHGPLFLYELVTSWVVR